MDPIPIATQESSYQEGMTELAAESTLQAAQERSTELLTNALSADETLLLACLGLLAFLGLAQCVAGKRIFKGVLFLVGLIGGGIWSTTFASDTFGIEEGMLFLVAVAGGVLGGLALTALYYVGVFALGIGLGGLASSAVLVAIGTDPSLHAIAVPALLVGVGVLALEKIALVGATAIQGAWAAVCGTWGLVRGQEVLLASVETPRLAVDEWMANPWLLGGWLGLTAAGVAIQLATRKRQPAEAG